MTIQRRTLISLAALGPLASAGSLRAQTTVPGTPAYTILSQDFFDAGQLMTINVTGTISWDRGRATQKAPGYVINGADSFAFRILSNGGDGTATPTWGGGLVKGTRYRITTKMRSSGGTLKVKAGFRSTVENRSSVWAGDRTTLVGSTTVTVVSEFVWLYDDANAFRWEVVGFQPFSGYLLIDDYKLESADWDGLDYTPGAIIPTTLQGYHLNQSTSNYGPGLTTTMLRTWDRAMWRLMNPSQGTYNFANLGGLIASAQAKGNGCGVLFTLGDLPQWAAAGTAYGGYGVGSAGPLANIQYVKDFVNNMFAYVGTPGKIKAFELWNEVTNSGPNQAGTSVMWWGTVQGMVDICAALYPIIKAYDPNIVVLAPNVTDVNGYSFLEDFIALGGDAYCDAYSYHQYLTYFPASGAAPVPANVTTGYAFNLRRFLNDRGITKKLWNTEGGLDCSPSALGSPTSGQLSSAVATMAANGVQNFNYYTMEGIWHSSGGTPNSPLTVAPAHTTNTALGNEYNRISSWLVGSTIVSGYKNPANGVYSLKLTRSTGGTRFVVWADSPVTGAKVTGSATATVSTVTTILGATSAVVRDSSNLVVVNLGAEPVMIQ